MSEQKKIKPFVGTRKASHWFSFSKSTEPSPVKNCCPKCGSPKVRRSVRHGILEYLVSLFGVYPYDCTYYTCLHRFYRRRQNSLVKSQSSLAEARAVGGSLPLDSINCDGNTMGIDQSVADYLYDGVKQQKLTSIDGENQVSNSDRYDFSAAAQLQPRKILTLNWNTNGKQRTHIIYSQNRSGSAGRVKLGRNPAQCDLVFADRTVSGINAEIYFDCQLREFYLSNLRSINPPFINQKKVISTVALRSGMILYLGRVPITIEIDFDYADIEPTLGFDSPTHLFDREEHSN